jgi:hypothetical protein
MPSGASSRLALGANNFPRLSAPCKALRPDNPTRDIYHIQRARLSSSPPPFIFALPQPTGRELRLSPTSPPVTP